MISTVANPWRGRGLQLDAPLPCHDATGVGRLLSLCPAHIPTPLRNMPELAERTGVAQVLIKDERSRMGLGSFKALGAAHAIARDAASAVQDDNWTQALDGQGGQVVLLDTPGDSSAAAVADDAAA